MARRTAYDQAAYVEASMFYARNQGISHHMVCKNPNRSPISTDTYFYRRHKERSDTIRITKIFAAASGAQPRRFTRDPGCWDLQAWGAEL